MAELWILHSKLRIPLLLGAIATLLIAMLGGLGRLGWNPLSVPPTAVANHGPLMIVGFLAGLIALERAVASRYRGALIIPAAFLMGTFILLSNISSSLGISFWLLGAVGLIALLIYFFKVQPSSHAFVSLLGACSLILGILKVFRAEPIFHSRFLWMSFFILTISAERLELSRLVKRPKSAKITFLLSSAILFVGALFSLELFSLATVAICLWLLRYDLAFRTIRTPGFPRFSAACLLSGMVWLGISGVLTWLYGSEIAGVHYDAYLHSLFLGFVFSMVFGHAPIIFPTVTGIPIRFRPFFYVYVALLHLSLILRLWGDLVADQQLRLIGAFGNALSILLFVVTTAYVMISKLMSNRSAAVDRTVSKEFGKENAI